MKKILLAAFISASVMACTNEADSSTELNDTTDNAANATGSYTEKEGDVTYRNGKVMVWRDNQWVEAENDVEVNGMTVRKTGVIVRDGEEVEMEEGEVVGPDDRYFDEAGNAIQDGWDGLKKGAHEAKEGVKKGYNEAKDEVKEVFDGKERDNN